MIDHGNNLDKGDALTSPNIRVRFNISGRAAKYRIVEGVEGTDDSHLITLVNWKEITGEIRRRGYVEYTLADPNQKGWVRLIGQVSNTEGRVSNIARTFFYYGEIILDAEYLGLVVNAGQATTYENVVTVIPQVANGTPTMYYLSDVQVDLSSIIWKPYSGPLTWEFKLGDYGSKTLYCYVKGMVGGQEVVLQYGGKDFAWATIVYARNPFVTTEFNLQIPLNTLGVASSDELEVVFPQWKHNKKWVLSPQVDDSLNFYASNAFNYVWGRPFGTSGTGTGILGYEETGFKSFADSYKDIDHDLIGYDDGTGLIRPYRFGVAFNSLQLANVDAIMGEPNIAKKIKRYAQIPGTVGIDLSSTDPDWSNGEKLQELDSGIYKSAAINSFKGTAAGSSLPYPGYTTLADLGFGISNHGSSDEAIESMIPVSAFAYCLTGSKGSYDHNGTVITWDIAGNWLHSIVIPGGKSAIMTKFRDYDCFYFFTAANDMSTGGASSVQGFSKIFKPFTTTGWSPEDITVEDLTDSFKCRIFPSNTPTSSWQQYIDDAAKNGYWLIQSSHGSSDVTPAFYKAFIDYLHSNYGSAGDNSAWIASQEEVYEYLYMRKASTITLSDDGTNLNINVKARGLELFYYNELSLLIKNVSSATTLTNDVIDVDNKIYTLSAAPGGNDDVIINLGWDPRSHQRAAKWLANYLSATAADDLDRAAICDQYYLNLYNSLKPGKVKERLDAIYTGGTLPPDLGSITLIADDPTYTREIQVRMNVEGNLTPSEYMIGQEPDLSDAVSKPWSGNVVSFTLSESYGTKTLYGKILINGVWSQVKTASVTYLEAPSEIVTRVSFGFTRKNNAELVYENGVNRLLTLSGENGTGNGAVISTPLPMYNNLGNLAGTLVSDSIPTSKDSTAQSEQGTAPTELGVYTQEDYKYRIQWNGGWSPRYGTVTFATIPAGTYEIRLYDSTGLSSATATNATNVVTDAGTYTLEDTSYNPYNGNTTWALIKDVVVTDAGNLKLEIRITATGNPKVGINIVEFVKKI